MEGYVSRQMGPITIHDWSGKQMKISNEANQIDREYLTVIENSLRRQQAIAVSSKLALKDYPEIDTVEGRLVIAELESANKARVLFDLVKKFLDDRSMVDWGPANRAARGGWDTTPCLLDDDGKEVRVTDEATVVTNKWSR
jgi:hypothetical protein